MLVKNLLNSFFSAPKFICGPVFGLDISEESIKFVELIQTGEGKKLGKYGERDIPPGTIEKGKIKNPKIIEEILVSLRESEKIYSVRVSLPEEQVYLFRIKFKKESIEDIAQAIEFSLEEHVPMPAQDVVFDYEVIREDASDIYVQVAAISQAVILDYINIFDNAKIEVSFFELEAQAIERAVVKKNDKNTYMIVDFGKKRTGISIVSDGVLLFTSTIDVGGVMLTNVIKKSFKTSFEEAEGMKQKFGLGRDSENKEMFSVLLNGVSVLRDEISKHFIFWHTNKEEDGREHSRVQKIILCGGDSNLKGLADYLSVSMKIKVDIANVWINVLNMDESIPEMGMEQSLSYSTAIGLALGNSNNGINLIPSEKKKKNLINSYYKIVSMFFIVSSFVAFLAVLFIFPSYLFSSVKKNISFQKLNDQKLEAIPKLDADTVMVLDDVNKKLDILDKVKEKKYIVSDKIIKEVISRKTSGIKITGISYKDDVNDGKSIHITGIAKSREQLLLFRESFENTTAFKKVNLPISNFVKGSNIQFYLNLVPA